MALLLQVPLIVAARQRQLGIIPCRISITTLRLGLGLAPRQSNRNTIPSSSSSLHNNRLFVSVSPTMASTAQKVKNTFQTKHILN